MSLCCGVSVTIKPIILSVVVLNVIILSVVVVLKCVIMVNHAKTLLSHISFPFFLALFLLLIKLRLLAHAIKNKEANTCVCRA